MYWRPGGGDTISETNLAGTNLEEYIFFSGRRVARRDVSTNAVHYCFSDHLGSASAVTNATGSSLDENLDYYPFGGLAPTSTDSVPQSYKFTGKERDAESGLDEFGARYYASNFGRFMTPDWAARATAVPYAVFGDPQSLNLYGYVRNDPVSRVDPDGHGPDTPLPDLSQHAAGAMDLSSAGSVDDAAATQAQVQADQGHPQAQSNNLPKMSVEFSEKPGIHQNADLRDGKSHTVVGAQLKITLTDSKGNPLSGSVKESNKEGGTQNPNAIPLSPQGTFKDWVGPSATKSSLSQVQEAVDSGIDHWTSTQTLTITTKAATYQAGWARTVNNVDARGKVGDLTVTWTTPVITQISP